jgi:hypothetical protein
MAEKIKHISETQNSRKLKKPVKIGISKPIADGKKTYVK